MTKENILAPCLLSCQVSSVCGWFSYFALPAQTSFFSCFNVPLELNDLLATVFYFIYMYMCVCVFSPVFFLYDNINYNLPSSIIIPWLLMSSKNIKHVYTNIFILFSMLSVLETPLSLIHWCKSQLSSVCYSSQCYLSV